MATNFYYDLTSLIQEESNKVYKNIVKNENNEYTMIRYNKTILNYDLVSSYGLFRSVILNNKDEIVCFAPPKSMLSDLFIQKYPDPRCPSLMGSIVMQEFVEGTMINVFWDPSIGLSGGWEIATRNNIGGNTKFYQYNNSKTFREMFLEAMAAVGLTFDHLYKNYCYSFVLQHPENRIVVPFSKPDLYLVATYYCLNYNNMSVVYPVDMEYIQQQSVVRDTYVKTPKEYNCANYKTLIQKYASMNTPYHIMGAVVYNKESGERCKIRNPVYEQVRLLKGNQPKLQYQYLCLRQQGKVSEYLKFYPEDKEDFSRFRDDVHLFTKTLLQNYISCFVKKDQIISEFPEQYQRHMLNLQRLYLTELREKKGKVDIQYVVNYVNQLHPSKLMFSMNYQMRKRNVDLISGGHIELVKVC